jgi:hypothetical protein
MPIPAAVPGAAVAGQQPNLGLLLPAPIIKLAFQITLSCQD